MVSEPKPKKPRKKPKPSALTRPPKRGKKKKKPNILRPSSPFHVPPLPLPQPQPSISAPSAAHIGKFISFLCIYKKLFLILKIFGCHINFDLFH